MTDFEFTKTQTPCLVIFVIVLELVARVWLKQSKLFSLFLEKTISSPLLCFGRFKGAIHDSDVNKTLQLLIRKMDTK